MSIDVRELVQPSDLAAAAQLFRTAMIGLPRVTDLDPPTMERLFEGGRTFGAWLDGQLAGTTNSHSGTMVVPGGRRLAQAAVTHVGVLATAGRRGVARALMTAQLRQARDRGEVLASLRATEAGIYGNFGYGVASASVDIEIDRRQAVPAPGLGGADRPLRDLDPDASWALQARIYETLPDPRPGMIQRPGRWWRGPAALGAAGGQPLHVVACGAPGAETGYVRYHPQAGRPWVDNTARTVIVDDLIAHGDADLAALFRHLLSLDIVHRIRLPVRPVDDPLPLMLRDYRAARVQRRLDETWLRILDVATALAARSYRPGPETVLEVRDDLIAENNLRLRLGDGAARLCDAPAAVVVDVAGLSSAYLGGVSWWQLAASGRLARADPAAIRALDGMFAVERQPYAGTMF